MALDQSESPNAGISYFIARHHDVKRPATLLGRLALAAGLIVTIAGCTSTTREWQEEVQLSDGSVLDVERTIRYAKVGVPAGEKGSGWIADGEELAFVDPGTGRSVHWSAHRRLASYLDRADGQYLIVAAQSRCEPVEDRGQPLWKVYVLTRTGWEVVETSRLGGKVTPNLALDSANHGLTNDWSRLTIADKRRLNAESRVAKYRKSIDPNDPMKCF
jgi:hypothetical protein